jgi:hypothetical protein
MNIVYVLGGLEFAKEGVRNEVVQSGVETIREQSIESREELA